MADEADSAGTTTGTGTGGTGTGGTGTGTRSTSTGADAAAAPSEIAEIAGMELPSRISSSRITTTSSSRPTAAARAALLPRRRHAVAHALGAGARVTSQAGPQLQGAQGMARAPKRRVVRSRRGKRRRIYALPQQGAVPPALPFGPAQCLRTAHALAAAAVTAAVTAAVIAAAVPGFATGAPSVE